MTQVSFTLAFTALKNVSSLTTITPTVIAGTVPDDTEYSVNAFPMVSGHGVNYLVEVAIALGVTITNPTFVVSYVKKGSCSRVSTTLVPLLDEDEDAGTILSLPFVLNCPRTSDSYPVNVVISYTSTPLA